MKRNLLCIAIAIAMFPGFCKGVFYLKKDITALYCFISESCKDTTND